MHFLPVRTLQSLQKEHLVMTSAQPRRKAGKLQMGTLRKGSSSALCVTSQVVRGWTGVWNWALGLGAQRFRGSLWWGLGGSECYRLDAWVLQNSYIEIVTPKVMVLEGRTFGR